MRVVGRAEQDGKAAAAGGGGGGGGAGAVGRGGAGAGGERGRGRAAGRAAECLKCLPRRQRLGRRRCRAGAAATLTHHRTSTPRGGERWQELAAADHWVRGGRGVPGRGVPGHRLLAALQAPPRAEESAAAPRCGRGRASFAAAASARLHSPQPPQGAARAIALT